MYPPKCIEILADVVIKILDMSIIEDNCLETNNISESTNDSIIEPTIIPLDESQEMLLEILWPRFERNYETVKSQNLDKGFIQQNAIKNRWWRNKSNWFFS